MVGNWEKEKCEKSDGVERRRGNVRIVRVNGIGGGRGGGSSRKGGMGGRDEIGRREGRESSRGDKSTEKDGAEAWYKEGIGTGGKREMT
jgi:hypothetical protein